MLSPSPALSGPSSKCARTSASKTNFAQVEFGNTDPTWEQLNSSLAYLDEVVHESLRIHPPVPETRRVVRILPLSLLLVKAVEDNILPLATPVVTKSGETINSIFVAKGELFTAPIQMLRAEEIKGHRFLLTFINGTLGEVFALAEFKSVSSEILLKIWF
ncbi:uncharacterized protein EV420DRAFT_1644380 [Desarmillaria tabescens]|uniref:Uncharacterized protein n=1 Tax=Armillaria tabescens TaxID=1929756 RepID=A0AA39KB61_ARMTA|nr:uncharacterized protein EV420DRAFT_1644380 [Desarmillaria tabescens]KAK0455593.1 hypothetical protein EV420DRAFT_1644380 [Desarmillaria tabescens]